MVILFFAFELLKKIFRFCITHCVSHFFSILSDVKLHWKVARFPIHWYQPRIAWDVADVKFRPRGLTVPMWYYPFTFHICDEEIVVASRFTLKIDKYATIQKGNIGAKIGYDFFFDLYTWKYRAQWSCYNTLKFRYHGISNKNGFLYFRTRLWFRIYYISAKCFWKMKNIWNDPLAKQNKNKDQKTRIEFFQRRGISKNSILFVW